MESCPELLGGEPEAFSSSPTGPLDRVPPSPGRTRKVQPPASQTVSSFDKFCFLGAEARAVAARSEMAAALWSRLGLDRVGRRPEARQPPPRLALRARSLVLSPPTLSCLPEPSWNSRGGQAEADPAPHERGTLRCRWFQALSSTPSLGLPGSW